MDKLNTVLNKLGFRGSSDDDGHRSAQSTPRLSRHLRVRDATTGRDSQRSYGSVGSMENYRLKVNQDWTKELELHQNSKQKKKKKTKSIEADRVPRLGLDRAWEMEHAHALEQAALNERPTERSRHREGGPVGAEAPPKETNLREQSRNRKKKKEREKQKLRSHSQDKLEHYLIDPPYRNGIPMVDPNFALQYTTEPLDLRIEELNQQLLVEKHGSRRDKLTLARIQQEIARQKSERQLVSGLHTNTKSHGLHRETLMRELERERMLRMDAEQRLHDVASENEASKSRLRSLQEEFRKMEDMVRSLIQYKGKLEALKNEKASLSINFENNMQKFRTHVGNLEHENKILMAEIKKIEFQCANCHLCNKDFTCRITKQSHSTQADGNDPDKTKVLLERLKMLEAEKSALVLENERQGYQYEKCLDEISNRVVQALMSQKTLREECAKLQKRVQDLESQNKQLSQMFMQKIKFASDSFLQSLATKKLPSVSSTTVSVATSGTDTATSLNSSNQVTFTNGSSPRTTQSPGEGHTGDMASIGTFSEVSLESLQSICSDYIEQAHMEDTMGMAQLSSPPPWLRDQMFQMGDSPTSSTVSPSVMDSHPGSQLLEQSKKRALVVGASSSSSSEHSESTQLEKPGPSTVRASPIGRLMNTNVSSCQQGALTPQAMAQRNQPNCVLEPNVIVRNMPKVSNSSGDFTAMATRGAHGPIPGIRIETEFPIDKASPKVMHHGIASSRSNTKNIPRVSTPTPNTSLKQPSIVNKQDDIIRALTALTDKMQGFHHNICNGSASPGGKCSDISPGQELLRLGDNFPQRYTVRDHDGLPRIQNNLYDDSDSDDSYGASRPISKFSATSTISLSELLDQGLDDMETPNDDNFSIDDFHLGDTDEEKTDQTEVFKVGESFGALIQAGRVVMGTEKKPSAAGESSKKSSSSQTSPGLEQSHCECDSNSSQVPIVDDLIHREDVILNNAVVSCKPPLPRPLTRPNSLDLPVPSGKGRNRHDSRGCNDYSSSDSSSDSELHVATDDSEGGELSTPNPPQGHRARCERHKQKERKRKTSQSSKGNQSPVKSEMKQFSPPLAEFKSVRSPVKDLRCLDVNRMKKDHGDYVLLCAPGKLAKLANQDSGVSEMHESKAVDCTSRNIHKTPAEFSPETANDSISVRNNVTSSPDSAMQQSFSSSSSTGSDAVIGEKPSFRDDGYSSNSAVSFADGVTTRSNLSDCVQDLQRKTEQISEDETHAHVKNSHRSHSEPLDYDGITFCHGNREKHIGKLDGFNPDQNLNIEKSSVRTREGICEDMKELIHRRPSCGNVLGTSLNENLVKGLVSNMKSVFEGQTSNEKSAKESNASNEERRLSLPVGKEEGDYVCLDPYWPPLGHVMPEKVSQVNNNNSIKETTRSCITPPPSKPSRPKMGIHAKTIASQRSRSLPRSIISTYPSDPCLSRKISPPSPKMENDKCVQHGAIKRTSSDSCLTDRSKSQSDFIKDLITRPLMYNSAHALQSTKVQTQKVKINKRPKSRSSSLSTLKQHNVSSPKDKNQCIVGYVISEPPVPQFELDVKIPSLDPGYFKTPCEVRMTGEGSEHGYKSSDEPLYMGVKRPEVVGAVEKPRSTDTETQERSHMVTFDVRKYNQQVMKQSHRHQAGNISMWSSDSDGDSKNSDIQLVPLTILSPSTSPSQQLPPPDVISSPEEAIQCDYNLNRKRQMIMSYPPRTSHTETSGTYHTLPVDGLGSRPNADFKQLIQNLAKKSEDVLKSKIFHSESCDIQSASSPDYDNFLKINFEEEPRSSGREGQSQIVDITQEIENLTRTVNNIKRNRSDMCREGVNRSRVMTRSAGPVLGQDGHRNYQGSWQNKQMSHIKELDSSSCDDEADEPHIGGASLGDSFIRKFRRRKKSKSPSS